MTISMTPDQARCTLAALRSRLANMEGVRRRLLRASKPSTRMDAVVLEIMNLQLAISAFEMAMEKA
jgi:hypothetical protein